MSPYSRRRQALLRAMEKDSVAIFPSGSEKLRSGDSPYRFRPDSDFYYLTGHLEQGAVLVVAPHHPDHRVAMFVAPRDSTKELWSGARQDPEEVQAATAVDAVFSMEEFEVRLEGFLTGARRLYHQLGVWPELDARLIRQVRRMRRTKRHRATTPTEIVEPSVIIHEMRLVKEADEIAVLRRAAAVSAEAHRVAMMAVRPGVTERVLEALLDCHFRSAGGAGPGYPTIVAGGRNATTLHYVDNAATLMDGDLVLIDAGGEFGFYTADITRTFPVSGRFSRVQRTVYDIVLEAQRAAIDTVAPGARIDVVHGAAVRVLARGLVSLGLLQGDIDALVASEAYRPYYMHRTSHWLGMEVHDVGEYRQDGKPRVLEPGMVLTVEPGLYFRDDVEGVPEPYRGIGVRIEDDVLVTKSGREVLTEAVPKDPGALEALVGTGPPPRC